MVAIYRSLMYTGAYWLRERGTIAYTDTCTRTHACTDCVVCRIQSLWREAFALGRIYSNSKLNPSIHLTVFIFFPPSGDWDQQEKKGVWSPWGGGEEKEPVMSNSGESLYKFTSYERVSHAGCHIKTLLRYLVLVFHHTVLLQLWFIRGHNGVKLF